MRAIKFRGKSLRGGEWYYGNLYDKDTKGNTHICTTQCGCLCIDPETVGQFTGLRDKQGREIYEGDIVRYSDESDDDYPRHGVVDSVVFEDGCFWPVSESWARDKEVIGNIHDNPELLKKD